VRATWWQEQQDEVIDGFLVEPQNQGRAGTTWEPSHEWLLAVATPSSWGLRWLTAKPSGHLVEPQNQDRRLGGRRWDLGASRSFDAGGRVAGSQGLRREDADYGDGMAVR
jgi:hypothetical protein